MGNSQSLQNLETNLIPPAFSSDSDGDKFT